MESDGDESTHQVIIAGDYDETETYEDTAISESVPQLTVRAIHTKIRTPEIHNSVEIIGSSNIGNKAKYYRQTYRTAWENMPDFKGWLKGVPGEPQRAFCIYCQKSLHAHRLSLLKHTCTLRHQKAAQIHQARKKNIKFEILVQNTTGELPEGAEEQPHEEQEMDEEDVLAEEAENIEHDQMQDDEEEDALLLDETAARYRQQYDRQQTTLVLPPISTHAFDTTRGVPIHGLAVSLYKLIDGRWTYINEGTTNMKGRVSHFVDPKDFSTGRYKLHYDVDRYFEAKKQESFFPFVEIIFDACNAVDHYHIPLLLSPYGYTTYRGSS